MVSDANGPAAGWTRLEHSQCTHRPLRPDVHPHCPIASHLVPVIAVFRDCLSHERALVEIETEARTYRKRVDLQTGISSLRG
jgi:hypothetical protein